MVCGGSRTTATAALASAVLVLGFATRPTAATGSGSFDYSYCGPRDGPYGNGSAEIRWANTTGRLYLEGGGCATMTQIWESRLPKYGNNGPVYPFDDATKSIVDYATGSWYLDSTFHVRNASKLVVQGTSVGGDCDRLLLASSAAKFISLRAHGGSIWIEGTHVESWDLDLGVVDTDHEDGRSFISAISEVITDPLETCDGLAKYDAGEARLDIINSEVNHLGWYDSESYGISYKVRGYCKDHSNPEVFDEVKVTGDILRSHIHHNYFGQYSYGHQGGDFSYNEVHDNVGYGLDPHDDSDDLTIHNNHVYNNGWHGIIASKRCDHVSIQNNVVHDNGKNGLMLHRSCDYATVKNNTAYGNGDAGLALYESSFCDISENTFYHNTFGIRFSMGSSDNLAQNNHIIVNGPTERYGIFMYKGSDIPAVDGSDGKPRRNHMYDNDLICDEEAVKLVDADDNVFEHNLITGRRSRFRDAINTLWLENVVPDVYEFKLQKGSCMDPESDMDAPAEFFDDYSYAFEYDDGFFCSM